MEKKLETLEDLDETLMELVGLGVIQNWPSREQRFRVVPSDTHATDN